MTDLDLDQRGRDVVRDVLDISQCDRGRARALPDPIQSGPRRHILVDDGMRVLP